MHEIRISAISIQIRQFRSSAVLQLFHFFMARVFAAALTELAELQPVRGRLTVLGGGVVPLFALRALHGHDFSGHFLVPGAF